MGRKPLALIAVLAAAALGIGLLWRSLGSGSPAGAPLAQKAGESARGESRVIPAPLESAEDAEQTAARARDAVAATAFTESFPLGDARWIAGRVKFPDGSPPDETLQVWAFEKEVAIGLGASIDDAPELVRTSSLGEGWWSRQPIEPGGNFRIPIPKDADSAAIVLDGRFLFLGDHVRVDAEALAQPLLLEPKLGACLVGRCTIPSNAEPADSPVGAAVHVDGYSDLGRSNRTPGYSRRSTRVGADLGFELRGVPAEMMSHLEIRPARLLAFQVRPLRLAPGARKEVEAALQFGGRASGRVVDEQGSGLGGVALSFEPETSSILYLERFADRELEDRSSDDGTFELYGLPAVKSTVHANIDGFAEGRSEPLELEDGEVRKGLSIVLSRGHRVAGRVTWPDGAPAVGANVTARAELKPEEHASPARFFRTGTNARDARAGERGEFSISGFGAGAVTVFATAPRQPNAPGENPPKWYALLKGVAPDSSDLVLVLQAPSALEGRVVDDLERPVKGFSITAHPASEELDRGQGTFQSTTTSQVLDAEDGAFMLAGLQDGRWEIEVEGKGFVQTGDKPVVVLPRTEGPLVVRVERVGSVAGTVVDPDGAPVAGAEVSASRGSGGFRGRAEELGSATSDEKGAFLVENLRTGSSLLVARKEDRASSEPLPIDIQPEQRLEGQILRLRRGGRLTGEVFDRGGARVAGRTVRVFGVTGGDQREATVDDAGAFALESLSPGSYQVMLEPTPEDQDRMMKSAAEGGEVNVSEFFDSVKMTSAQIQEGETTHVVLGAPPKAPVRLFGRITRANEPVHGGIVVCVGEGGPVLSKMKMGNVSPSGDYELTLDEPGDIMLGYQDTAMDGGGPDHPLTVPEAAEFRYDLELPTGGIRGIVRGPDGSGVAGVRVSLRRGGDLASRWMSMGDGGKGTDPDGRFEFTGLEAGTYALAAPAEGVFSSDESPRWGRAVVGGLVVPKDQFLEGVELRLTAPCKVTGTVRDANGSPVADATIFARDERGHAVDPLSTCRSDASGSFTYAGVAPGSYTFLARAAALASAESAPVAAREGEVARVELVALPGTMLIVTFEDKEGHRLRGAISVKDERGREMTGLQGIEGVESLISEGVDTSVQRVGPLPAGEFQVSGTATDGRSARKTVQLRGQAERSVKLRAD